jgi:hypothetical protein
VLSLQAILLLGIRADGYPFEFLGFTELVRRCPGMLAANGVEASAFKTLAPARAKYWHRRVAATYRAI